MPAKTPAERRQEADKRKRDQGLYKPSVWIHRDHGASLAAIASHLEAPAEVTIKKRGGKVTITIEEC